MSVTVRFLADIGNWLSGLGDSKKSLEENEQALEDLMRQAVLLGREAGRTSDEIARDFADAFGLPLDRAERAVHEVIRETERLEDAADDAGRAGKEAGDDIEKGMDDAADSTDKVRDETKRTGAGMSELGDIARDVLAGDFGSAADSAVSALGSVEGKFALVAGGAGIVAGAIVGITTAIQAQQEEAAKLRERLSSAYLEAIEAGSAYIDQTQVIAELRDLAFNPDRQEEYNKLLDDEKSLGIDIEVLAGANIGRKEDLQKIQQRINTLMETELVTSNEHDSVLGGINTKLAGQKSRWEEVAAEADRNLEQLRKIEEAERRAGETAREQTNKTAETAARRYEQLAKQLGVPINIPVRVDDSEARNYVPPTFTSKLYIQRELTGSAGVGNRTWE